MFLSVRTYQREHEIEKGRAAVEEDGQERGDSGEKQAHVSAHHNPQRLQDLRGGKLSIRTNPRERSFSRYLCAFNTVP